MAQKTLDERFRLAPPTRSLQDRHAWMTSEERRFILWGLKEAWPAARIGRALGVNEATVRRFRTRFMKNPEILLDLGLCEMVGRAKDEEYRCLVCAEQIIARPAIERHVLRHFVGPSAARLALTARAGRQADSQGDGDGRSPTPISSTQDRLNKKEPSELTPSRESKTEIERPLSTLSTGPLVETERSPDSETTDGGPNDQLLPRDRDSQIADEVGLGDGGASAADGPESPDRDAAPSRGNADQPTYQRGAPRQPEPESPGTGKEPSSGEHLAVSTEEDPASEENPASIESLVRMALSRIARRREELKQLSTGHATESDAAPSDKTQHEDTAEPHEPGEQRGPEVPLPTQLSSQPIKEVPASDTAGRAKTYGESESADQGTVVAKTGPISLPSQGERIRRDVFQAAIEVSPQAPPQSQAAQEQPEVTSPSNDFEFVIEEPGGRSTPQMPGHEVEDAPQQPEPTTEIRGQAAKVPRPENEPAASSARREEIERIVGEPVSFEMSRQFEGREPDIGDWHNAFNRLATQRGAQGTGSSPDEGQTGEAEVGRPAPDAVPGRAGGGHRAPAPDTEKDQLVREKRLRDFERLRQTALQAIQQEIPASSKAASGPADPPLEDTSPKRPSDTPDQEWEDEL